VVVVAVLAAVAVVAAAGVVVLGGREPELPTEEVRSFLAAWAAGDGPGVDRLAVAASPASAPASASAQQAAFKEALAIERSTLELGALQRSAGGATATVDAVHRVRGLGEWTVRSQLRLVEDGGRWLVQWAASALHPDAEPGDLFERDRTRPSRAPILGAAGQPLTVVGKVVSVGVQPGRMTDQAAVTTALQQQLGVDPARLDAALKAPHVKPDHFVPAIDVREERFRQVEAVLRPVPGIVFQRKDARVTLAEGFAAHTLGRTGEITAEQLDELGPAYQRGDVVGRSGLELVHETTLAGTPSGEVRLVRKATGVKVPLHRFAGQAPQPVTTTLRPDVQRAADAALDGVAVPAALVAVDAATGALVAVSSRPLGEGLNRALAGRYPPGSTFKIVTTDALVAAAGADQRLACPREALVGGKRFKNFEGEALGDVTLRDAFVHSCNTAYVAAAGKLSDDELVAAAQRFGFGATYGVGLGSDEPAVFPAPRDTAERAAAAIGQGRVVATPAHMASVMAAAVTGTWRAPYLLEPAPGDAAGPRPTASPTPAAVEPLEAFLAAVVTEGTARAAAGVPGLSGKTGTAEFGSGNPLPTHAWFVGHRSGVAFAVFLEGGGVGGRDAAPVAARFAGAL
jgi:cell division protein FtsI/penicillin-binding protein 2